MSSPIYWLIIVKVGLVTKSSTLKKAHIPLINSVLPAPNSPERATILLWFSNLAIWKPILCVSLTDLEVYFYTISKLLFPQYQFFKNFLYSE